MFTINHDPHTNTFSALFLHATSSATLSSIKQHGIVAPDRATVLDRLLEVSPWLDACRGELWPVVENGHVGAAALGNEAQVHFSAVLGNREGCSRLLHPSLRVASHGDEVHAAAWKRVNQYCTTNGFEPPARRFPGAQPAIVAFRISFELCLEVEASPATKGNCLAKISWDLEEHRRLPFHGYKEVHFLGTLPPDRIVMTGTPQEVVSAIEAETISPAAQSNLRDLDRNFIDIRNKPPKMDC